MRLLPIILISITVLFGCSIQEMNSDYRNMFIMSIKESTIVIAPHDTDPEASYPVYEIIIDGNTKIEGSKHKFDELSLNDDVMVWVKKTNDEKEIAEKIFVQE